MRTSEQIYHRLRWDPRFDPSKFVVGIDTHGDDLKRTPLPRFVPGGDIPWHRVVTFEADGVVVWDRRAGVDRLDAMQVGLVEAALRLRPPFFSTRTLHRSEEATAVPPPSSLTIVTWNTLWDRYDADRVETARRIPLIVRALEELDADIIALQEVERPLATAILAAPWARAYAASDAPNGTDVRESGVLLLSRLEVQEVAYHALGPHKGLVAMTVVTAAGPIVIAAVHLSSDHTQLGAERRKVELRDIATGLDGLDCSAILLGDFNDAAANVSDALRMKDTWTELYGQDDTTVTFDPPNNPLARISSLTGRASRLDRVFVRGAAGGVTLRPMAARRFADRPSEDGLFASDHYGVCVTLQTDVAASSAESLEIGPTATTALAWVLPEDASADVQRVRAAHDPQIDRWPPHVNVLFGFVPESSFGDAVEFLCAAAREIEPFEVTLETTSSFAHPGGTATVYLQPSNAPKWQSLRTAFERRFPRCRGRNEAFVPHLTLGRATASETDAERFAKEWLRELGAPVQSQVAELVLLSRRGEEPMQIRARLALGTGQLSWVDEPSELGVAVPAERIDQIVSRLRLALPDAALHVTGSHRLGCAVEHSDLDLVLAAPSTQLEDIESAVRAALPEARNVRRITAARTPGLELRCESKRGSVDVDLAIAPCGEIPPVDAIARRAELAQGAMLALSGVEDSDAITRAVGSKLPAFQQLARTVKRWAHARGLDSAPFGSLPSIAWMVLAARTVLTTTGTDNELLSAFFGGWASWDFRAPITLDGAPPPALLDSPHWQRIDARMAIMTPASPIRSVTDHVGPASFTTLTEELYAAWESCEAGASLFTTPPLHRMHRAWAVVDVKSAEGIGWVRGRMLALLSGLEQAGVADLRAWPRPVKSRTRATFVIGLGRHPIDRAELAEITEPWAAGLPGVSVARAETTQTLT